MALIPCLCPRVDQIPRTLKNEARMRQARVVKRKCRDCGDYVYVSPSSMEFISTGTGYPTCDKCFKPTEKTMQIITPTAAAEIIALVDSKPTNN